MLAAGIMVPAYNARKLLHNCIDCILFETLADIHTDSQCVDPCG